MLKLKIKHEDGSLNKAALVTCGLTGLREVIEPGQEKEISFGINQVVKIVEIPAAQKVDDNTPVPEENDPEMQEVKSEQPPTKLSQAEWFAELNRLAHERGYVVGEGANFTDGSEEAWLPLFEEGKTPAEALEADEKEGAR